MNTNSIQAGDIVTVEQTRGWATATPTTRTVTGVAYTDDEGTLRVDGVNVTRGTDGYFPRGVVVLSVEAAS